MWPGWCNESTRSCNHGRYRHCQVDDGVLSLLLPWDPTSQPRSRIWRKKSWANASVSGQFLGVQEPIVWLQPKQWMIRVTTKQNLRRPAELMTAYIIKAWSMWYCLKSKFPLLLNAIVVHSANFLKHIPYILEVRNPKMSTTSHSQILLWRY